MKTKPSLLLVIAFVFALAGSVYAQESQSQQTSAPPASPGLDVQGIKVYLLGPGDVLDVRVFGQPELTSTVAVDADPRQVSLRQGCSKRHPTRVCEVHQ
jgi:protein involved in polysaccharide export with SLBB domain